MTNKKLLILILVAAASLAGLVLSFPQVLKNKLSPTDSRSSKDGRHASRLNLYSNERVGFDFAYPFDFQVVKNDLGDSLDGVLELNYNHTFGTSTESNSIIVSVVKDASTPKMQNEQSRKVSSKRVNKRLFRVEEIYFTDGSEIKNYILTLPSDKDFYLKFSITGTSKNFYYLDDLIESIKWR